MGLQNCAQCPRSGLQAPGSMQGERERSAVSRALLRGFFAAQDCYAAAARACGLQRVAALLMTAELPLDASVQRTLAWHEHVLAQALRRVYGGGRGSAARADMHVRHAELQRLAAGGERFAGGGVAAGARAWLRAVGQQRGAEESDNDAAASPGASAGAWAGDVAVLEAWVARGAAVCNADTGLASIGHVEESPSVAALAALPRSHRRGRPRRAEAELCWDFVPEALRRACDYRRRGPPGVEWPGGGQCGGSGGDRCGEVVDAEDWQHCAQLRRAEALSDGELRECLRAMRHATALVQAVPA